jgi:hypothetical protein
MRALNTLETVVKANGAGRADTPIHNGDETFISCVLAVA